MKTTQLLLVVASLEYLKDRNHWLTATGPFAHAIPGVDKNESQAQLKEDLFAMEHFFPDAANTGGVFFEMGAIDGVKLSNTYLLDRMGWRGLLIEANPLAAKMLFHNRPNSIGMNAAVCNRHQEVTYWTTGLISATGGIREFMTADFVKHWYPEGDGHKEWPLHCMPLGDIFDLVGMKHIHFASIDVEGAEVAVLDSVDWNKVQVDVMCIEANEPVEKLVKALEGTPLKFYKEEKRNAWFLNENVPSLARKLRKASARKHMT